MYILHPAITDIPNAIAVETHEQETYSIASVGTKSSPRIPRKYAKLFNRKLQKEKTN